MTETTEEMTRKLLIQLINYFKIILQFVYLNIKIIVQAPDDIDNNKSIPNEVDDIQDANYL